MHIGLDAPDPKGHYTHSAAGRYQSPASAVAVAWPKLSWPKPKPGENSFSTVSAPKLQPYSKFGRSLFARVHLYGPPLSFHLSSFFLPFPPFYPFSSPFLPFLPFPHPAFPNIELRSSGEHCKFPPAELEAELRLRTQFSYILSRETYLMITILVLSVRIKRL